MLRILLILFFLSPLYFLSYGQATARSRASACIVRPNDTIPIVVVTPILKLGMDYNETINILGSPIEKLTFKGDKQKWIYDTLFVYFLNGRVDIIVPIKKTN